MSYNWVIVSSFSIGLAAALSLIRFTKIEQSFVPFVVLVWLGLLNESISYILTHSGHSNAVNSNIYTLTESILLLWFFLLQGSFSANKRFFYFLAAIFIAAWVVEKFFLSDIRRFSSYFTTFYSFCVVLLSIHTINRLIAGEPKYRAFNAVFLICVAFILFYTYTLLVEIFWIYGLNSGPEFRVQVYRILALINLFVNLLYAVAIIWIPRKQEYTLL
jgi:hypothetical protein